MFSVCYVSLRGGVPLVRSLSGGGLEPPVRSLSGGGVGYPLVRSLSGEGGGGRYKDQEIPPSPR